MLFNPLESGNNLICGDIPYCLRISFSVIYNTGSSGKIHALFVPSCMLYQGVFTNTMGDPPPQSKHSCYRTLGSYNFMGREGS